MQTAAHVEDRRTGSEKPNLRGWDRLIEAHDLAQRRYHLSAIKAAEALKRRHEIEQRKPGQARISAQLAHAELLAAAEREETEAEAENDRAHDEVLRLERLALSRPATTPTALKFKLRLLGERTAEGQEREWRIFLADCVRLGSQLGW